MRRERTLYELYYTSEEVVCLLAWGPPLVLPVRQVNSVHISRQDPPAISHLYTSGSQSGERPHKSCHSALSAGGKERKKLSRQRTRRVVNYLLSRGECSWLVAYCTWVFIDASLGGFLRCEILDTAGTDSMPLTAMLSSIAHTCRYPS